MSNIVPFNFKGKEIRTILDENGNPWFVSKDIAVALGYSNPQKAVRDHCKKAVELQRVNRSFTLDPQTKIISESDLYRLTMRSYLKDAVEFQDWVVEEVLPTIRKTGSYSIPQKSDVDLKHFEAQLIGTKYFAELINTSEHSRLEMLHKIHEEDGVSTAALPVYTTATRVTFSASDLLKKNKSGLSAIAFNKLMIANHFLEEKERTGRGGKIKKFKVLTETGLQYGQNDTSTQNPRETQPHYFEDSFIELHDVLIQRMKKVA